VKPPPFRYEAPTSVDEVVALLAEAGDDGKVLAGGQSLIPLLNFRLAYPEVLVDISRVGGLDHVRVDGDRVVIGARATQTRVLGDAAVAGACPLLVEALGLVAHEAIRNRGTVAGSIAHADPSAELPAILRLLGGTVTTVSTAGTREIAADDLFVGPLQSALRVDELLTEVSLPTTPAGQGTAIIEHTLRSGDYALAGVAALVRPDGSARVATIGTGPVPQVFTVDDGAAVAELVSTGVEPQSDVHASADRRRVLAGVMAERALTRATERAA
jgi:aerobic carbon-monoxide dehydrogenase medium subunit